MVRIHQRGLSLSPNSLFVGDRVCVCPGTMIVNVNIITVAAVFPHYSDTHGAAVKIKMLIVFIPIEPPTGR